MCVNVFVSVCMSVRVCVSVCESECANVNMGLVSFILQTTVRIRNAVN